MQGLPPLIDRELLFGDPEITAADVSPDGKYLAFMKPWSKTRNIWVKKTEEPFSAAKLLTTETKRPVAGYLWSRDGKFILMQRTRMATRISTSTQWILPPLPLPAPRLQHPAILRD